MGQRKFSKAIAFLVRLRHGASRGEILIGDLEEELCAAKRPKTWRWRQAMSMLAFGSPSSEARRDAKAFRLPDGVWNDVRYAMRSLRASPALTAMAMIAIAFGVGVNSAVFTLFNAIALRPLPVPGSSRVTAIYQTFRGRKSRNVNGAASYFSYAEYRNYRDHNHTLSGLAAFYPEFRATLAGAHPRELAGQLASCNYFDVTGVHPPVGRGFVRSDCAAPGSAPVVVLSDALWHGAFGADPGLIGKTLTLNRVALTVIGIAPPGFRGTATVVPDFWVPLTMDPLLHPGGSLADGNLSWLIMLGRLKPHVSLAEARADLGVIAGRIDQLYPGSKTSLSVDVANFMGEPEMRRGVLSVSAVLFAAVGLVLLIACANVANLLLARATARKKEIAVRLSVGASRARLIRQLLTESILLALPAGLAGALLASFSVGALLNVLLSRIPDAGRLLVFDSAPDVRVLAFSLALTILTGVVFGLAPALAASRPDLVTALKEEGAGAGTHRSRGVLRNALVVAQVSVCLLLLITAGLLARGLAASQTIEPGFQMKNVAVADFDLELEGYDNARAARFERTLQERVSSLPGVDAVARATVTPLSMSTWGTGISLPGHSDIQINFDPVSTGYFALYGIPIVRGRNFTEAEEAGDSGVAIVMESTARKLWPGADPLGKVFTGDKKKQYQVVGVARDSHTSSLSKLDPYFFYFPIASDEQLPAQLIVHGAGPLSALKKNIADAAAAIDPSVVATVRSAEETADLYRVPGRMATGLAAVLGGFALLLASIGIYGVVSYAVGRRTREIGIRMTLGADRKEVLRLVLGGAMKPVVLGALIGVVACAGASQILSSVLYGVSPFDPVSFAGVTVFLLALAMLASYIPARRATSVDPMSALRHE